MKKMILILTLIVAVFIYKEVKNIRATVVNYANLKDKYTSTLVNGYEKNE